MKRTRKLFAVLAIGAAGAVTVGVGSSLVRDVQFARAEQQVTDAREGLKSLSDLASAYKSVNRAMEQSVVQVQVIKTPRNAGRGPNFDENIRRFFDRDGDGEPDMPEGLQEQATGSGVIMDAGDGQAFIVTNNHVVSDATSVDVALYDGRHVTDAQVVGTDPKSDLAVIKIKADRVIAAKWGDSDTLEKGDLIVAFGSPFGYVGSMSHGIVSATNRQAQVIQNQFAYENFIQVDAPINPGNSGGPLVNLRGEVVGINTAIASRTGSFAGIGFAIPSNQAKTVYDSLKTSGKVVRGYLGVQIADVKNARQDVKDMLDSLGYSGATGVLVNEVRADGPAFKVLKAGDVITEIDGKPVADMAALRNHIASTAPGKEVKMTVWRDKQTTTLTVKLSEQPDDPSLAATAKPESPAGAELGLGLVTPSADDLKAAGLPEDAKGALVKNVAPGSPAANLGIAPGDLIVKIGGKEVANADEAKAALKGADLRRGVRIDVHNKEGEKMFNLRRPRGR
jgi:serine protease Do